MPTGGPKRTTPTDGEARAPSAPFRSETRGRSPRRLRRPERPVNGVRQMHYGPPVASMPRREPVTEPQRPPSETRWGTALRVGGIALILVGITYGVSLYLTVSGAPGSGTSARDYLTSVSGHVALNAALWVSYILSDLLLIPGLIGLYLLLRRYGGPSLWAGFGLLGAYVAFDLGATEPNWLALTILAKGYGGATTAADQASYLAGGQYALSLVPVLNSLSFIVSATGFLLLISVMLRAPIRRGTSIVGIVVMGLAFAAGASWFVPTLGLAVLACLGGFAFWTITVGAQLYRIGQKEEAGAGTPVPRTSRSAG